MNQLIYSYVILIENDSAFLNTNSIIDNFEKINEMSLSSRNFDTYQQCEEALMSVLDLLTKVETESTQEEHTIVTINRSDLEDPSSWNDTTISKKMIIQSNKLDEDIIDCSIIGLITSNKCTFSVN